LDESNLTSSLIQIQQLQLQQPHIIQHSQQLQQKWQQHQQQIQEQLQQQQQQQQYAAQFSPNNKDARLLHCQ
jgi:hypothetical protein